MAKFLKKIPKQRNILPLVAVLVVSLCAMFYFGHQKEGYHVDELYSYGLANSEYLPFMHFGESGYDVKDWMNEYGAGESLGDLFSNLIKDFKILKECNFDFYNSEIYQAYRVAQENSADTYTTTWVSGQDYRDYLAVSESNTFNYFSVYYNQRGDVHPPLFYILLHTLCSVFQGVFSKWFGLGLNIVLLLLTLVVLYRMCEKHFGGRKAAIAVVCMYAFSTGFMSTAMFIRMYALLTLMTVLCTYVHLEIRKSDYKFNKKLIAALFFSILGGYYTQYYFVLYAIGIAAVMIVCMVSKKKWKSVVTYIITLASSAITGICIWPFSIKHVFGGYRGQTSLNVLQSGSFYAYKAEYMLKHIVDSMFGGYAWLPIVIVVLSAVICIFCRQKDFPLAKTAILSVPIVFYTLIVGQISPFLADRYVMCTYPFWCIMVIAAGYYAILESAKRYGVRLNLPAERIAVIELAAITCILISCNNYVFNQPGYLNTGGQETYDVPENTDCVFIIPDGSYNESSQELNILAKCDRVGIVYESNLDVLAEDYNYESGRYLLVEVINSLEEDIVLKKVRKALGVDDLTELEREYASGVTRILLGE